jgi:hypothetical protein
VYCGALEGVAIIRDAGYVAQVIQIYKKVSKAGLIGGGLHRSV